MKTFTKPAMLIMALLCTTYAMPQWVNDTIKYGQENNNLKPHSLFVSNQNTVHLTYLSTLDWESYDVIYRYKACDEEWTIEESILEEGLIGRSPAVTATNNDIPYIAFQKINDTGTSIAITWKLYGTWRWEELPCELYDNESPSIAIDEEGNVHLAWVGVTEDYLIYLCYANNINGIWNLQIIEDAILGEYGWDAEPDIEVTSDGIAYIFYNGGDPGDSYQYIATNSQPGGEVWKLEKVITPNINDFAGGIEIYQDQTIHAVVEGDAGFGFPSTIFYTYKSIDGQWSEPDTVNKSFPGTFMGMGIDNEGIVYAAYMKDEGNMLGDLYIADNSDGIFQDSLLMSSMQEIQTTIMCPDKEGNSHVIIDYTLDFSNYSLFAMRNGECLPTAIDQPEINNTQLNVYPNPVTSFTSVTIEQTESGFVRLDLFDVSGRLTETLYSGKLVKGSHQISLDLSDYNKGLYLLRFQNESGIVSKKLLRK